MATRCACMFIECESNDRENRKLTPPINYNFPRLLMPFFFGREFYDSLGSLTWNVVMTPQRVEDSPRHYIIIYFTRVCFVSLKYPLSNASRLMYVHT
jgi:hypothetical protein